MFYKFLYTDKTGKIINLRPELPIITPFIQKYASPNLSASDLAKIPPQTFSGCLLYTSDAADE